MTNAADKAGPTKTGIKEIKEFFGMKTSDFMAQWKGLSAKDKLELRQGILDGSLTY